MKTRIIGIDCAVEERNVGIAVGAWSETGCVLENIPLQDPGTPLSEVVCRLLKGSEKALIALDAPLGWPNALGQAMFEHKAGLALQPSANALFRRATDIFVKDKLDRQPLDVGADRIARTAYSALKLLAEVREKSRQEIPLAWNSSYRSAAAVIEVYPAGTLIAHGLPSKRYKKKEEVKTRSEILGGLRGKMEFSAKISMAEDNPDILDAIVCVLAGSDFLSGHSLAPKEQHHAEKEGWIWFREPDSRQTT